MRGHAWIPLLIAPMCAVALAAPALAAKPVPEFVPIAPGTVIHSTRAAQYEDSLCFVGETQKAFSVNYLQPPDDAYYALLRVGTNTSGNRCFQYCPGLTGGFINRVHVVLDFPVSCEQPITYAIYGAEGDSACRTPALWRVVVPPISTTLQGSGITDFELPLPRTLRLVTDMFLCVTFPSAGDGCATPATQPRLVVTGTCVACENYNIYPGGNDELCSVLFPGNLSMYAGLDSCLYNYLGVGSDRAGSPASFLALSPNPTAGRRLHVEFRRATAGPSRLELFDLLGHRLLVHDVSGLGDGVHELDLEPGADLRPGLYLVRLTEGGRSTARKVTLLR